MQLAPSLHRIGSDIVNCYLVEQGGLVTIIDAGLPGHWRELLDELRHMGRSLEQLAMLDARWVLPGHGPAWGGGVAEAVHRYRSAAAVRTRSAASSLAS